MNEKIKNMITNFIKNTTNIATLNSRALFVKENLKEIIELSAFLPDDSKINERLYIIYNDLKEKDIICPMCSNKRKFYTFTSGYNVCCSTSCATKYQQKFLVNKEKIKQKRKQTIDNISKEIKDKWKIKQVRAIKEKYGENGFSEISKKGHQTKIINGTFVSGFKIIQENDPKLWEEIHKKASRTLKFKIDENGNNHYQRVHIKKLQDIDENGNNHYQRVHIKKLQDIDENGNNHYQRVTLSNYEKNIWTKPEDKSDLVQYRVKVAKVMYKFKEQIEKLENFKLRGHANKGLYHLDHKFSVIEGFKQNIPVYIVGHICNLEMIKGRNNLSKNRKCSIGFETLINNIKDYNSGKSINYFDN